MRKGIHKEAASGASHVSHKRRTSLRGCVCEFANVAPPHARPPTRPPRPSTRACLGIRRSRRGIRRRGRDICGAGVAAARSCGVRVCSRRPILMGCWRRVSPFSRTLPSAPSACAPRDAASGVFMHLTPPVCRMGAAERACCSRKAASRHAADGGLPPEALTARAGERAAPLDPERGRATAAVDAPDATAATPAAAIAHRGSRGAWKGRARASGARHACASVLANCRGPSAAPKFEARGAECGSLTPLGAERGGVSTGHARASKDVAPPPAVIECCDALPRFVVPGCHVKSRNFISG